MNDPIKIAERDIKLHGDDYAILSYTAVELARKAGYHEGLMGRYKFSSKNWKEAFENKNRNQEAYLMIIHHLQEAKRKEES